MAEIKDKLFTANSRKLELKYLDFDCLDESIIQEISKYSLMIASSLSATNQRFCRLLRPLIQLYTVYALEDLFTQYLLTHELLALCGLTRAEPYTSLRDIYSKFLPHLDMEQLIRTKIMVSGRYALFTPIIKRRLAMNTNREDGSNQNVNGKLIIESSMRSIYASYLNSRIYVYGPSFTEFCNFINDIYGIYQNHWTQIFMANIRILDGEVIGAPAVWIFQNKALFYHFIDKKIILHGFYQKLLESQSFTDSNFDAIQSKELEIGKVLKIVNDFLAILVVVSLSQVKLCFLHPDFLHPDFPNFRIHFLYYLIIAEFYEIFHLRIKNSIRRNFSPEIYMVYYLWSQSFLLYKRNSYFGLILIYLFLLFVTPVRYYFHPK